MDNATDILLETAARPLHADASEVALRVGVSASLVRKVLAGTRRNDKVARAYLKLLKEREEAKNEFQGAGEIQKGTSLCA